MNSYSQYNKYHTIQEPPVGTVRELAFSNFDNCNLLAATSFDGDLKVYEVCEFIRNENIVSKTIFSEKVPEPLLGCSWISDTPSLLLAGGFGSVFNLDLVKPTINSIPKMHNLAVMGVKYDQNFNVFYTAGIEGILKVFDVSTFKQVAEYVADFKISQFDITSNTLVCAAPYQNMAYFDVRKGMVPVAKFNSSLDKPTSCLRTFESDGQIGYIQGCVAGRTVIKYIPSNVPNINQEGKMTEQYLFN